MADKRSGFWTWKKVLVFVLAATAVLAAVPFAADLTPKAFDESARNAGRNFLVTSRAAYTNEFEDPQTKEKKVLNSFTTDMTLLLDLNRNLLEDTGVTFTFVVANATGFTLTSTHAKGTGKVYTFTSGKPE